MLFAKPRSVYIGFTTIWSLFGCSLLTIDLMAGSEYQSPPAGKMQEKAEPAWKAEFRKTYGLKEGELLKHVPEPFPACRKDYIDFLKKGSFVDMNYENFRMSYRWNGKDSEFWSIGPPDTDGVPFATLLQCLGIPEQELDFDEDWRTKLIPGEFIARAGADPLKAIPKLEDILRKELNFEVWLVFKDVERDVVVVSGKYNSKPRDGRKDHDVDLFAVEPKENGVLGTRGTFNDFINAIADYIQMRLVNEVKEAPDAKIRWYDHRDGHLSVKEDKNRALEGVLKNLSTQTGLTFKTEKRKVRVLFVGRR
jgi:hypothetical protein